MAPNERKQLDTHTLADGDSVSLSVSRHRAEQLVVFLSADRACSVDITWVGDEEGQEGAKITEADVISVPDGGGVEYDIREAPARKATVTITNDNGSGSAASVDALVNLT